MKRFVGSGLVAIAVGACTAQPVFQGVDVSSGQSVTIEQSSRGPANHFRGAYLSPQFGFLTLEDTTLAGNRQGVTGKFHYISCEGLVTGKLCGTVEGNLLRFTWTEDATHFRGWHGHGKGRLFYSAIRPSEHPSRLFGNRSYLVEVSSGADDEEQVEVREAGVVTAVRMADGEAPPQDVLRCP